MNLDSPIQNLKLIGPKYLKRLHRLGIKTVKDLIYHFPYRYEDFSKIVPIAEVSLGQVATVQGKIIDIKNMRTWRKKMNITEAIIEDKSGAIKAVWFNQPFLIRNLKKGDIVSFSGKTQYDGKMLYLSNPMYEKISIEDINLETKHTGRLVPIYPETEGITSKYLRFIIKPLLSQVSQIKDYLPQEIKKSQNLLDLSEALVQIHFPDNQKMAEETRHRLAFDELFLIQLFALHQKNEWQKEKAIPIKFNQLLVKKFVESLPFKLTNAQRKSAWEILQDLEKTKPMNRLLEGDVGSGKTSVAAIAALEVAVAGFQVAFMAPTEILARQHFENAKKFLKNIDIGLLTGSESKIFLKSEIIDCKKKEIMEKIKKGGIKIIIGTHALIQKEVKFKSLALAIVDEQHRFGIQQRAALQKNIHAVKDGLPQTIPHLLSMTATPIPRTLALTIYGDLDISLLNEMPKNRKIILTKVVSPENREKAYQFIRQQIKEGRQVFVICPRIENKNNESGIMNQGFNDKRKTIWNDVKAVKQEYEKLSKKVFPDLKIAMLHGKIKPKEKEKIMKEFAAGQTNILVSTSVVEVGIDVPNATVMMIEGADRFGLAQLHQFRGRVGRSKYQSYCLLFATSGQNNRRLNALVRCKDGFELAEKDLKLRGPGEFYGTRQWGLPDLSMASLTDIEMIKQVRQEIKKLVTSDPELKKYPLLKKRLKEFQANIHLE